MVPAEIAQYIYEIIKDYRNHDGIQLTTDDILGWADQFGEDSTFVLTELFHLLPEVYLSREKAKLFISDHLTAYLKIFGYHSISTFLSETEFLDMQQPHKSQAAILELLEEVLMEKYQESYKTYLTFPKINFVYFDDVLASGSTVGKHLQDWLLMADVNGTPNHSKLLKGEIKFAVSLFCCHRWGLSFQQFRINSQIGGKIADKINWIWNYEVQNHAKFNNQRLNVVKPLKSVEPAVNTYFASLTFATKYEDYAFRAQNTPARETFFSSAQNRIKFENVMLEKGIEIIGMIQGEVKANIRPLGLINPTYKILGLGTHFFTWRNIPNNSPLVYWWEVPGHSWKPLFPVANRGK